MTVVTNSIQVSIQSHYIVSQAGRSGGGGGRTSGDCRWVFVKHWNSIYVTSRDNVGRTALTRHK